MKDFANYPSLSALFQATQANLEFPTLFMDILKDNIWVIKLCLHKGNFSFQNEYVKYTYHQIIEVVRTQYRKIETNEKSNHSQILIHVVLFPASLFPKHIHIYTVNFTIGSSHGL